MNVCVCVYRDAACSVEGTQARMYSVSSLCVRQSVYIVCVKGARARKKKERLPRSAANPLCRPSASPARTISVIFISIASLSDLAVLLFPPPSYPVALLGCLLGSPTMTADIQRTRTHKRIL